MSVAGKLKSGQQKKDSDRSVPGQGEVDDDTKSDDSGERNSDKSYVQPKEDEQKEEADDVNIAEGLEAEEGDFVNVEVAFAYRARTTGAKDLKNKVKNAHLYLAFYLPGGVRFRKSSIHSYYLLLRPSSQLALQASASQIPAHFVLVPPMARKIMPE